MKIFNRTESDPPENASCSKTVRVNFSGRNRICDAVPATIIVSCKIVTTRITDRLPCYPGQVNISRLLKVIAMAVSNTSGIRIKLFCIARVQELCQSSQILLRSNQPRVFLCTCPTTKQWCFCCKRHHWHQCDHEAHCQQKT